jgi:cysteine rich repeat protein
MKRGAILMMAALAAAGSVQAQAPPDGGGSPDRQAARAAMMKACDSDIKTLCADKQGREVMMCLRGNSTKLSSGCSDAMAQMPMRRPGGAPPPAQ